MILKNHTIRRLFFLFTLVIVVIIAVLTGYIKTHFIIRGTNINISTTMNSLESYENVITSELSSRLNTEIESLNVTFSKETDAGGYVSQFISTTKAGENYEGNVYAISDISGKWLIKSISFEVVNRNVPFTQSQMSGQIGNDSNFFIISGVVNNDQISYIKANFVDGALVKIMINKSSGTYAYVRIDKPIGIKEICGYSENGSIIHKY